MEWCRDIRNIHVLSREKCITNNSGTELKFWVFHFYSCIWNKNVKKNQEQRKKKGIQFPRVWLTYLQLFNNTRHLFSSFKSMRGARFPLANLANSEKPRQQDFTEARNKIWEISREHNSIISNIQQIKRAWEVCHQEIDCR